MPRQTREERREEQDRRGRAWAQWLAQAMAEPPIDVKTLVERARREGATFDKTNVSRWLGGEKNAEPNHAAIVARILGRDPLEALRAAGHAQLADDMQRIAGSAGEGGGAFEPFLTAARAELAGLEDPAERDALERDLAEQALALVKARVQRRRREAEEEERDRNAV